MNTTNGANNSNGHNINMNATNNSNQFTKSLDDWLNSNCNNMNNHNNNGTGIISSGGGAATMITAPNNDANRSSHLDDWLNATMKDSPKTFSVSSTEFLDGPSRNVINANGFNTTGIVMPPINLLRMMPEYHVNKTENKFPSC